MSFNKPLKSRQVQLLVCNVISIFPRAGTADSSSPDSIVLLRRVKYTRKQMQVEK